MRMPPLFRLSFNMNVATIYMHYYMPKRKKVNPGLKTFLFFNSVNVVLCQLSSNISN
jgi:hypothetical protein